MCAVEMGNLPIHTVKCEWQYTNCTSAARVEIMRIENRMERKRIKRNERINQRQTERQSHV